MQKQKEGGFRNLTMFSNVLNSLIKITWRVKTNINTKENKQNENNDNKEERMHTCIVMGFRHSHIEISFNSKRIYRVLYIGRVPFEI